MLKQKNKVVLALVLALFLTPVRGQQPVQNPPPKWPTQPTPPPARQQKPPPIDSDDVVKISTNLVQIDTVVTKNDKQVTDLTAADFEVFEDGKPQQITSFSYVWTVPKAPNTVVAKTVSAPSKDKDAPPVILSPIRADEPHRTIAIVVDDLGISMESIGDIRRQLRKFVDEQLEPNDLVAIIRTGGEVGALQQFTNDKRLLMRAVDSVKWNHCGRAGISIFPSAVATTLDSGGDESVRQGNNGIGLCMNSASPLGDSLGALKFILRGMSNLPGRKSMVILSESLPTDYPASSLPSSAPTQASSEPGGNSPLSNFSDLQRLAELAIRSSVVIYGIDTRGLQPLGPTAADTFSANLKPTGTQPFETLSSRAHLLTDNRTGQDLLTRETGGFLVKNSNSFGLKRIVQDQSGYYLIGYRPTDSTFNRRFHHITVKAKPSGLNVRTRSGFFGMTDEEARPLQLTNHDRLNQALISPFVASDIEVHLTALFADDLKSGLMVRSLIYFSGRDLVFVDEPDDWHKATLNLAAAVFGDNGLVVQQLAQTDAIRVRSTEYERLRRDGLVYQIDVPVNKPGAYQFRVAVRDESSSLMGTARQFVDVPDTKKRALFLSGITVSGDTANAGSSAGERSTVRMSGPAIRRFAPADNLWFGYVIYNAQTDNPSALSSLTAQARLYRDGKLVYSGTPKPIETNGQTDLKRINGGGGIKLGPPLEPGEYLLQIVVTEALGKDKFRVATQWIDFDIVK